MILRKFYQKRRLRVYVSPRNLRKIILLFAYLFFVLPFTWLRYILLIRLVFVLNNRIVMLTHYRILYVVILF